MTSVSSKLFDNFRLCYNLFFYVVLFINPITLATCKMRKRLLTLAVTAGKGLGNVNVTE